LDPIASATPSAGSPHATPAHSGAFLVCRGHKSAGGNQGVDEGGNLVLCPRNRKAIFGAALLLMASGCDRQASSQTKKVAIPVSLPELLQAHDVEVAEHGKDLVYIKPIGRFGREGVLASLEHLQKTGKSVSSCNGVELIFGVAIEAKMSVGYHICQDRTTLDRLIAMSNAADVPSYERFTYGDFLKGYCKQKAPGTLRN
jgi:hypothetical protein